MMIRYVIYNKKYDKFLNIRRVRDGFIDDFELIDSTLSSIVLHYHSDNIFKFTEDEFVIDTLNFLKTMSGFEEYVFCRCTALLTDAGLTIIDIDHQNPILDCSELDNKIGEKIS